MTDFELPSNSGMQSIRWIARGVSREGPNPALFFTVVVRARLHAEDEPEISLTVGEIWIRLVDLEALRLALSTWIRGFDNGHFRPLVDVIKLGGTFDHQLILKFGPRSDLISERHEAVTICYAFERFQGELSFVVDQSCIRLCLEGLCEALTSA